MSPPAPLDPRTNLGPARAIVSAPPDLGLVAVFDFTFHSTPSALAHAVPLPRSPATAGLRRFGFRGLSCAWTARRGAEVAPACRRVVAQLVRGGSSACAICNVLSLGTTMGATPLDVSGIGARSTTVDPGLLLHLLRDRGAAHDGLSGSSGKSAG